jgi:hypothetical protein
LSAQVNSVERIQKFAKRAWQYLNAYHAIDSGQVSAQIQQDCSKYGPVGLKKLLAKFRTHRYAIDDFDFKLLMNPDQKSWSCSSAVDFVFFQWQQCARSTPGYLP